MESAKIEPKILIIPGVFKDLEGCDKISLHLEPVQSCVMGMNLLNCPKKFIESEAKCLQVKSFLETNTKCGYNNDGLFEISQEFWFSKAIVLQEEWIKKGLI